MKDTSSAHPPTPAGTATRALIVVAAAAGVLAWVWLGEWRWAVTALVVVVLLASAVAVVDSPRARMRRLDGHICSTCGQWLGKTAGRSPLADSAGRS